MSYDKSVLLEDARPAGEIGECFFCRKVVGEEHSDDCVILKGRKLEATPIGEWQPIESYSDGDFVLFWFPNGERGNGGMETAMAFADDEGAYRSGWSHGGPNSGLDFDFPELPTMWARLPLSPFPVQDPR